jgi:hypothetical protein
VKRLAALVLALAPALAAAQEPPPTPVPTPAPAAEPTPVPEVPPAPAAGEAAAPPTEAPVEVPASPAEPSAPPPPAIPEGFASAAPLGDVTEAKPEISFQPTAPDFVFTALRIDGVAVTDIVVKEGDAYVYRSPLPFAGGDHTVEIDYVEGQAPSNARWTFHTTPPPPRPDTAVGWSFSGEVFRAHSEPVGREGPTTNQTLPTIAPNFQGSVTDEASKFSAGWNATYTQSYDPNNPPPHVSPPAVVLSAQKSIFKATLGNGPLETFAPSTLVQTISTRRGLELGLDSALGSLRVYSNIDDGLPSSAGVNEFRQNLYGVSVTPAIDPSGRFKFRLLWQYAEDVKDPLYNVPPELVPSFGTSGAIGPGLGAPQQQPAFFGSAPKKGQLISGSVEYLVVPEANFLVKAEGVRSYYTNDSTSQPETGDWAWAVTAAASPLGFTLSAGVRDVGNFFGSPANPGLIAGRLIWDVALSRAFGALSVSATYARTNDGGAAYSTGFYQAPTGHADALAGSVSYNFESTRTGLSLTAQENRAQSAGSESKQTNLSLNVSQPVGVWQASLGLLGGRQESSGTFASTSDLRGATLGIGTQGTWFSLQTSFGYNQTKNPATGEKTTSLNAMLTPDLNFFDRVVNLTPIGTWTSQLTPGGASDTSSFSYGARLTLRTWGSLKGFGIYGQYVESQIVPKAEGVPITRDRRMSAGFAMLLGGGSLGPQIAQQIVTPQGGR